MEGWTCSKGLALCYPCTPVPKKGDLKLSDNWRDIRLLDIVRKVLSGNF